MVISSFGFISDLSKVNSSHIVEPTDTLADLLPHLEECHRVLVNDPSPRLITQTDVNQFIARHVQRLGTFGQKTIEELDLGTYPASVVPFGLPSVDAFFRMFLCSFSGSAIIGSDRTLIGQLSMRDLKVLYLFVIHLEGLQEANFSSLSSPVGEWIVEHVRQPRIPPLKVSKDNSLEVVILKLAATRGHRLWIVNDSNKVEGVISLTDVMRLFNELCQKIK